MKRERFAFVRWIDPANNPRSWFGVDDYDLQPLEMTSCGLIVKETKTCLSLALTQTSQGKIASIIHIPKLAIVSQKRFKAD